VALSSPPARLGSSVFLGRAVRQQGTAHDHHNPVNDPMGNMEALEEILRIVGPVTRSVLAGRGERSGASRP
jgi:hypothetical protein